MVDLGGLHPDGGRNRRIRLAAQISLAAEAAHGGKPFQRQPYRFGVAGGEQVGEVVDGDPQLVDRGEDVVGVGVRAVALDEAHHGREWRDVPDHRQGAVLGVQRQRDPVLHGEGVHRRPGGGLEPVVRDPVGARGRAHLGVGRVEEEIELGCEQVLLVRDGGGSLDAVGVVEDDAEVADLADARLGADGRLPRFDPRVAQRALLRLAAAPVEVDLLVGAAAHAHPPGAALLLVDEHDAVLLTLVHRAGRARGDARGIEAVLADAREVEHECLLVFEAHLLLDAVTQVRVEPCPLGPAGEVVLPVRAPFQVERLPGDLGLRPCDRLVLLHRCRRQRLVVVRPRLVVVVERGQIGVEEQRRELAQPPAGPEPQLAPAQLPAALPFLLVFPALRVADTRLRLDVVEPGVLDAAPVRPHVLAGDRAGVAADALVEVHHHRDLRPHLHQYVDLAGELPHHDDLVALRAGRPVVVEAVRELGVAADQMGRLHRDPRHRVVGAAARAGELAERHVHVTVLRVVHHRRRPRAHGARRRRAR